MIKQYIFHQLRITIYSALDTAPTGHTLRMLQLPSAWSNFISESTHGASCLGQLSGLESKKEVYKKAVETLADKNATTIVLVTRPEIAPLKEAERASNELAQLNIRNQILIVNGVLDSCDDEISKSVYDKQHKALLDMPSNLQGYKMYQVPLRAYNITGLDNIRNLLVKDNFDVSQVTLNNPNPPKLQQIVNDLHETGKKVIFTMGKGGVGKTTIAATIALGLSARGKKVHLTTTDPAAHLKFVMVNDPNITVSHIDEQEELLRYREEILTKAKETMSEDDLAYIEEDLRSPCTQEIAVFRAFAEIVDKAENEVVVIDTAPTGHTLLLLDSTQNYHREVKRTQGNVPESVVKLLPRLRNESETTVVIVTLAEATPVFEAKRLEEDLIRAQIPTKCWVINSSLYATDTKNKLLKAKASHEIRWINEVATSTNGNFAIIPWQPKELSGENLLPLLGATNTKKKVAFVCVHNSCRSQMAEALCKHYMSDTIECYSAGTELKSQINQDAVRLMKQLYGIDMEATQRPKLLSDIPNVDVVITMGCNVSCPTLPCSHQEDWGLDDPSGKSDDEFIKIISLIDEKVKKII